MRSRFDEQLSLLNKELIEMGALCEAVIGQVAKALDTGNAETTAKVATLDSEIDRMEHSIESLCLKLLLQQQPVARDLRQISAALKMITDMERIGDQAADIAEIISFLHKQAETDSQSGSDCAAIGLMADAAMKMVTESVDAFVRKDVHLAQTAIDHDDIVDDYFKQVKKSLISIIAQRPEKGEYALDLLMIAKYFERIGDHAVNIAEWVVFAVTGVHKGEMDE